MRGFEQRKRRCSAYSIDLELIEPECAACSTTIKISYKGMPLGEVYTMNDLRQFTEGVISLLVAQHKLENKK